MTRAKNPITTTLTQTTRQEDNDEIIEERDRRDLGKAFNRRGHL